MINREAREWVRLHLRLSSLQLVTGYVLPPVSGLTLSRAILSANLYRLPLRVTPTNMQNPSGQFYWLDGWSHPQGGDIP